jgi:uncharacterized protein (DUF2147 family)
MRLPILIGCGLALFAGPGFAAEPTGDWLVENGGAHIHIENCGDAVWGVVAWEKTPGRDSENPDPALKGRPTLGIPILINMKPTTVRGWGGGSEQRWEGHVYNAENGKTYTANIKLTAPNTLHIEGCVLGGIFCGGQDWSRVTAPPAAPKAAPKAAAKGSATSDMCSRVSNLARPTH